MTHAPPPPDVAAVFDRMPARAGELRDLVLDTAAEIGLPPPSETLKWGEPAYVPGRSGTTVRIGPDKTRDGCKLLVHCGTSLVEGWRTRFNDRLDFEGNRAVLVDAEGALDSAALRECIRDALTYHRKS